MLPFRNVDRARQRYLCREEAIRLLNSCDPDFRKLVTAALHTGLRYGELTKLRIRDFRGDAPSIYISDSKSGLSRHVFLSEEASSFFESQSAGRKSEELLFRRQDGSPWGKGQQRRRIKKATVIADIEPVIFHELRHTYASLYLMGGGSIVSLAKQLGHSSSRMVELHYGHLADSWRAEEARLHAPTFGKPASNLHSLRAHNERHLDHCS